MDKDDAQNEFEWEDILRDSDQYAAKYFRLLRRFCDLPGSRDLIADRMGEEFRDQLPDCDLDCEDCCDRWNCEFDAHQEWFADEEFEPDDADGDDADDNDQPHDADWQAQPGDALFFESDPAFNALRQNALGWCNIYAAILPPESRRQGLVVLFEIGRSLANLGYSISDGLYEQPGANIAFAKRSLFHLNQALGGLQALTHDLPRLTGLLTAMRKHLLKAREAILSQLENCRRHLASDTP